MTHRRRVPDQSATYGNVHCYDHMETRLNSRRHFGDVSPISRRHMETITVTIIWKQGFKLISTLLMRLRTVPVRSATSATSFRKCFHLTQLSPMCPRGGLGDASPTVTIIWKPGFTVVYDKYDRVFDSIEELITFPRDSRFEGVIPS